MDSVRKAREKRLNENAVRFDDVNPTELLPHLKCLSKRSKEKIDREEKYNGPSSAATELWLTLPRYDDWFEQLIPALREFNHKELANLLEDPTEDHPDNFTDNHRDVHPNGHQGERGSTTLHHRNQNRHENPVPHSPSQTSSSTGADVISKATAQTRYTQLPAKVLHILRRLDVCNNASGKDWTGLAGQLGFNVDFVERLKSQQGSPTEALLSEWSKEESATLGKLMESLQAIEREDVCQQLEELLGLYPESRSDQFDCSQPPKPISSVNQKAISSNQSKATPPAMETNHHSASVGEPNVMQPEPGTSFTQKAISSNPVLQQSKVTPSAKETNQSSSAAGEPQMSSTTSTALADDGGTGNVGRPKETASCQQARAEASCLGDSSGEAVAGKSKDESTKKSMHKKLQNGVRSKGDNFERGVGVVNYNTTDGKLPEGLPTNPVSRNSSQMPVNNLNRNSPDTDQNDTGSVEYDANCTGRTLLSTGPDTRSSSNNTTDSSCNFDKQGFSPDDYIGRLRTNKSMDDSVKLLMSEKSCSTLILAGPATISSAESTSSSSQATPTPSLVVATTVLPVASTNEETNTDHHKPAYVEMQVSSQGAPIQQPTGASTCVPDEIHIPSIDGTFIEDELIRASTYQPPLKTVPRQQASRRIQQVSSDIPQQGGSIQHQPCATLSKSAIPKPLPALNEEESSGHPRPSDASREVHVQEGQAIPPVSKMEDESTGSPRQPNAKNTEASSGIQDVSASLQQPCSTEMLSAINSSPCATQNDDDAINTPQQHDTKTLKASGGAKQEASSPNHVHTRPPLASACEEDVPDEDVSEDDPQQPGVDEGGAAVADAAAAQPEGRGALVGAVVLVVPVVLSLAAALRGGDIMSNW